MSRRQAHPIFLTCRVRDDQNDRKKLWEIASSGDISLAIIAGSQLSRDVNDKSAN